MRKSLLKTQSGNSWAVRGEKS